MQNTQLGLLEEENDQMSCDLAEKEALACFLHSTAFIINAAMYYFNWQSQAKANLTINSSDSLNLLK